MPGLRGDSWSNLDDRQRMAVAAQEFQKAGVGVNGVRDILEQEDPVAPTPPNHLLAPGATGFLPPRVVPPLPPPVPPQEESSVASNGSYACLIFSLARTPPGT
jgi:hypothetical protein